MTERIRLLTYNIHRGISPMRRKRTIERIAGMLQGSAADVVCLQEVWSDRLGCDLEEVCRRHWPGWVFSHTALFENGHQGNAVLSAFPHGKWSSGHFSARSGEHRGYIHVEMLTPKSARPFSVFGLHLGLTEAERIRQADEMAEVIERTVPPDRPVFVAGDFNDWRKRITRRWRQRLGMREAIVDLYGRHARTFPAVLPLLPLDRIYYRGANLVEAGVPAGNFRLGVSDHLPLEGVFEI